MLPYLTLTVTEQGGYSGLTIAGGHRDTECPANPLLRLGVTHLHKSLTSAKDVLVVFLSLSSHDKGTCEGLCKMDLVTHSDFEARSALVASLFTGELKD